MSFDALHSPMDTGTPPAGVSAAIRGRVQSRLRGLPEPDGFDALTDLFLGEVSGDRPRVTSETNTQATGAEAEPTSVRSETVASVADLDESEPAPEVAASQVERPAVARESGMRAVIECVVLGNLPAGAGNWVGQYVREIAEASGRAVAYLRLNGGFAHLELVGGQRPRSEPASGTLEAAIARAAQRTTRWVIRTDAASELVLASGGGVDIVTLLTGADEAARVSAYSSVKQLGERLPVGDGPGGTPAVRVAMMGVESADGAAAARKVADAVRAFLGRDVQLAACAGKIRSVRAAELLFSGPTGLDARAAPGVILACETIDAADDLSLVGGPTADDPSPTDADEPRIMSLEVESVLDEAAPPAIERPPHDQGPDEPAPRPSIVEPAATGAESSAPAAAENEMDRDGPSMAMPMAEPTVAAALTPIAIPTSWHEPVPAVAARREPATPGGGPKRLAARLSDHLAGLTPMAARCPHAPGVEIAMDGAGTLHLLAASTGETKDVVVADLLVGESWLRAHATLVSPSASSHSPVLHLFTSEPKAVRRLLDTGLRVHLLVRVGGTSAPGGDGMWYCTDLN